MVSVIIPVYNSKKYLTECLDSVISQDYSDIEIICVNDGSTDGSEVILSDYASKDPRIMIITKENSGKGAAAARNLGFSKSRGEYVMFLDSDDFFERNLISSMMNKEVETGADLVICGADRYDDRSKRIVGKYTHIELDNAPQKEYFTYKDCPERIFQIGDILVWNKLYKRKLIEKNNLYFEEIPISDDQMVPALSLVLAQRISVVDKALIHYRFNTGSSQVDSQNRHPSSAYQASFTIVNRMRELGIYESVRQSYINHAALLMREYFDKMTEYDNLAFLYHKYRDEIFSFLEADDLSADYFYEKNVGKWYELIAGHSLEEILFMTGRAYGSPWNTAIMRFALPYDRIKKDSDIVLLGKGILERYWYAQILLSNYCNVVAWVDTENEIPEGLKYDDVLEAKG